MARFKTLDAALPVNRIDDDNRDEKDDKTESSSDRSEDGQEPLEEEEINILSEEESEGDDDEEKAKRRTLRDNCGNERDEECKKPSGRLCKFHAVWDDIKAHREDCGKADDDICLLIGHGLCDKHARVWEKAEKEHQEMLEGLPLRWLIPGAKLQR